MQVAGPKFLISRIIHRVSSAIEPVIFCLDAIGTLGVRMQQEGVPLLT